MTENEPTVQVPVTRKQLDAVVAAWVANRRGNNIDLHNVADLKDRLHALLSQATAEPMRTAQGDGGDRLIEVAESVLGVPLEPWQMRLCRRLFGGNVGRRTGRPDPEPHRIESMASGATFTMHSKSGSGPWRVMVCRSYSGELSLVDSECGRWGAGAVDPSTIRDVTPPAVTP